MARTAPVPNMVAIPGMNPGIFVLGGGGDGGGSGEGGGKGKGKGQGANGKNGGKDANGGGPGANGCGAGSGSGCTNPAHGGGGGTHAGDPIDPVTGRVYTIPETDLPLVGPLVFALRRAYSSRARDRDDGLGHGWSHSLAWSLQRRRRSIVVQAPFREPVHVLLEGGETVATIPGIGTLRVVDGAAILADEKDVLYRFIATSSEPVHDLLLTEIADRAGNRITLSYDGARRLDSFTDSAGRQGFVRREAGGRIARFELVTRHGRTVSHRRYDYDENGDLVATTDAVGRRVRFAYDEDHLLTEIAHPTGRTVHYRYDKAGRCVESWVDHPGAVDPSLADDVPGLLADGATKAKGVLHVRVEYAEGTSIVTDSRQTRRFDHDGTGKVDVASGVWVETTGYDAQGRVTSYTNPEQHVTSYARDAAGRVVGITDPTGATDSYAYDDRGHLTEAVDSLGNALRYVFDDAANLRETNDAIGRLLACNYDDRGLRVRAEMPNGAVTFFEHDAEGNLVRLVEPDGRAKSIEVNDVGLVVGFVDEEGNRTAYQYDAMNTLVSVTLPNGAKTAVDHDAEGHIAAFHTAAGVTWRLHWGGNHMVHRLDKPSGESLHYRYDREGQLVRIVNERGEVHTIERDVAGRVAAETFFDGRHYRYKLDAAGNLALHTNGAGEKTELERDAAGRVTKRIYEDGSEEGFEYDSIGRLTAAAAGEVRAGYTYDARGRLIREQSTTDADSVVVDTTFDPVGHITERRASVGGTIRYERDLMGRATRLHLPGGGAIERILDGLGREVVRSLPEGGAIVCRYDSMGAMVERRITGPGASAAAGPEWVGRLPQGVTHVEGFATSPSGSLIERTTSTGDREVYGYDALGRITERSIGGRREQFAYGGAGLVHEVGGPERTYGPGGVPLRRGAETFEHDAEARRVRKVDEAGGETRYFWNGRGLLSAVRLPDGSRVEYTYDTDGRRVRRRRLGASGAVVETRFAWSQGLMFHEADYEVLTDARRLVRERVYVHDDVGAPLAHRETVHEGGVASHGPWVHYVPGPADLPALLLSGDGAVLSRVESTVWGAATFRGPVATPLRFLGQYFDEDTGLSYNRFRYYDPALGLFINADPSGLDGGTGAFEYARGRPFQFVDPLGLQPVTTTITSSDGTVSTGHSTQHPDHSSPQGLHPIVWNALPDRGPYYTPPGPGGGGGMGQSFPGGRPPNTCGEPHAISNHIRAWEQQHNGGQPLNPNDPRDRAKIQQCLGSINSISSQHADGTPRAPCANCSQTIANLQARYGAPATSAVQPGFQNAQGTGAQTNFTPPHENFLGPRRQFQ